MEKTVTSFSEPGASVALLAWPTPRHHHPTLAPAGSDSVVDRANGSVVDRADGTGPDHELADAAHVVERLGRTARVERVPVDTDATGAASRPFWADLIGGSGPAPATVPTTPIAPSIAVETSASHDSTDGTDGADLIITSLPPALSGDHCDSTSATNNADVSADLVALFAAHRLQAGGILAVLTHSDWAAGELTDPTGAVVAAGQNADLLYLQHIVALHAPIHAGQFVAADEHPDHDPYSDSGGDSGGGAVGGAGDAASRAGHHALVRGLPAPHRRIHSDVLVFGQPRDHRPPLPHAPDLPTEPPTEPRPAGASRGGNRR